jgi:uncharacterized protein YjbI with pentapeptide repeats
VDFTLADLRRTTYIAAHFEECNFKHARLENIDFQSSTFRNCTFEGELREVIFYRKGFGAQEFPENEMSGVDFSRAKLRWTEFRGLDLKDVCFPTDNDHIVLDNFPESLDRLSNFFGERSDANSKRLAAVLAHKRKWVGPGQRRGVFNKMDLLQIAGEEALQYFLKIVDKTRQT